MTRKIRTANCYLVRWWIEGENFARSVQHMAYSEVEAIGFVMMSHKITDDHVVEITDITSCRPSEYKGRKKQHG